MQAHVAVLLLLPLLLPLQPGVLAPKVAPETCGAASSSTHLRKGKGKRGEREKDGEAEGEGEGDVEVEGEGKRGERGMEGAKLDTSKKQTWQTASSFVFSDTAKCLVDKS